MDTLPFAIVLLVVASAARAFPDEGKTAALASAAAASTDPPLIVISDENYTKFAEALPRSYGLVLLFTVHWWWVLLPACAQTSIDPCAAKRSYSMIFPIIGI